MLEYKVLDTSKELINKNKKLIDTNKEIINIDQDLFYLPSENDPVLSADVGIFSGGKALWLYDCGASDKACTLISGFEKVNVTISHFHRDHSFNLQRLNNVDSLYVSKYSFDYFKAGTIVTDELFIEDGGMIHIFPVPNSHCKGSLGMEINEKYVFLGDSVYGKHIDRRLAYNVQLLLEQYRLLERIKADKCIISHDEKCIIDKAEIIAKFDKILTKRKVGETMIVL